jgi:Asp-tRNA(Asn)/Glu-tRNA(Gln) amidotransferase B subunit
VANPKGLLRNRIEEKQGDSQKKQAIGSDQSPPKWSSRTNTAQTSRTKSTKKKSKKNPKRYFQFPENFPIVIRMAQHTEQRRNAMYENLKDRIWAIASLMEEINQTIENNELNLETLEELFHELEIGDYSLMSAVHGAWVEAKDAQEAGAK